MCPRCWGVRSVREIVGDPGPQQEQQPRGLSGHHRSRWLDAAGERSGAAESAHFALGRAGRWPIDTLTSALQAVDGGLIEKPNQLTVLRFDRCCGHAPLLHRSKCGAFTTAGN